MARTLFSFLLLLMFFGLMWASVQFYLDNQEQIDVVFLNWHFFPMPKASVLYIFFMIGFVVSFILLFALLAGRVLEVRRLKKEIRSLQRLIESQQALNRSQQ